MQATKAGTGQLAHANALDRAFRSYLRLVRPDDAAFIFRLRHDPELSRHLSQPVDQVAKQREWIERYKEREAAGDEFYFVVVSGGEDRGVVRLYDFNDVDGKRSFEWGSWIIQPPRPPGLVTFSAVCVYELAFASLRFQHCHFQVRKANSGVVAFHLRAGARQTGETPDDFLFEFLPEDYAKFRAASIAQISAHRTIVTRDVSIPFPGVAAQL